MTQQWDDESKQALIAYRVTRADETIQEAELMYNEGLYHGAINRLYYACYYITIALLLKKDIQTHTHTGVKTMLAMHFVAKNLIPVEIGKTLSVLFERRQSGDYDDFVMCTAAEVAELTTMAKEYIAYIKKMISIDK